MQKKTFTIRQATPADAQALASVQIQTWRQAYRGIITADFLNGLSHSRSASKWQGVLSSPPAHSFVYLAESDSGEVVGFLSGGLERDGDPEFKGEIYSFYILPAFQNQGIGQALFEKAVQALHQVGVHSLQIWVLEENLARHFYEKMGGTMARRKEITIGEQQLVDVGYVWPDTRASFPADLIAEIDVNQEREA